MVTIITDEKRIEALNIFLIKYLKRFAYEFNFLSDVVHENPFRSDGEKICGDFEAVGLDINRLLEQYFDKKLLEEIPMFLGQELEQE